MAYNGTITLTAAEVATAARTAAQKIRERQYDEEFMVNAEAIAFEIIRQEIYSPDLEVRSKAHKS